MWDFVCRQPPEQAECQRNARLRRENRVAGDEYQPQEVVDDVMVEGGFEIWHGHHLLGLEFAAKLLVLGLKPLVAAEHVDRAVLRSSHEPRARIVSGMPDSGHWWSAARRASCASSSARPTSRTIRVRPALILADSILPTASMALCVSVGAMATH